MKTRAAILWEPHTEWSVEDIELDPPRSGEVLVKLAATGLCHSDEHLVTGDMLQSQGSAVPDHRRPRGRRRRRGGRPRGRSVAVGDHVVAQLHPVLRPCPSCASGQQNLCDLGAYLLAGTPVPDGTSRHHARTARTSAHVPARHLRPVHGRHRGALRQDRARHPAREGRPRRLRRHHRWGSAVYAAGVQPGETVVVIGVGGVGIERGAGRRPRRRPRRRRRRPGRVQAREGARVRRHPHRRVDRGGHGARSPSSPGAGTPTRRSSRSASPTASIIAERWRSSARPAGSCVTAVAEHADDDVQRQPRSTSPCSARSWSAASSATANPRYDIPAPARLYQAGKLKLDELVTTGTSSTTSTRATRTCATARTSAAS